jgi:hypothetical protein
MPVVMLAAIALMAAGCFWTQPGYDAAGSNDNTSETVIGVDNVASLHTRWSTTLASPATSIVQSNTGLVHVSDGTTSTTLDANTGATVWSRTEPAGVTVSGATGDGDDILVTTLAAATQTANLEVRDARTGATVSTIPIAPTGGPTPPGPPSVTGVTRSGPWAVTFWGGGMGSFFPPYMTGLGGFQVTNLDDPSRSWRFDGSLGGTTVVDGYTSPVIVGDRLYLAHVRGTFGSSGFDTRLTAWNLSGCTNQCAPLFETAGAGSDRVGAPDGRAVYATTNAGFAAFDPGTGAREWEATITGNSGTQLFAATDDAEDGEVAASLTIVNAVVGYQLAVYPTTCAAAGCPATWTTTFPAYTTVTHAVVAHGVVYTSIVHNPPDVSPTTTLAAYPLDCTDGCQPLWTTTAGADVTSGPIVSNGQVLYGTADGSVVALTP